jgi:hypothetical protein
MVPGLSSGALGFGTRHRRKEARSERTADVRALNALRCPGIESGQARF